MAVSMLFVWMSFCLDFWLSGCLAVLLSGCVGFMSVCLSGCMYYVCMSICLYICLCVSISVWMSVFVCLLCVQMSVWLFECLFLRYMSWGLSGFLVVSVSVGMCVWRYGCLYWYLDGCMDMGVDICFLSECICMSWFLDVWTLLLMSESVNFLMSPPLSGCFSVQI